MISYDRSKLIFRIMVINIALVFQVITFSAVVLMLSCTNTSLYSLDAMLFSALATHVFSLCGGFYAIYTISIKNGLDFSRKYLVQLFLFCIIVGLTIYFISFLVPLFFLLNSNICTNVKRQYLMFLAVFSQLAVLVFMPFVYISTKKGTEESNKDVPVFL